MAYADSARASTANLSTIATLLEGLLVVKGYVSQTTLINTTSTSDTAISSLTSTVTVAANQIVVVCSVINFSNSTAGNWVNTTIFKNGSAMSAASMSARAKNAGTAGDDDCITNFILDTPTAGSHTYSVSWSTAANTAYSLYRRLLVLVMQNT